MIWLRTYSIPFLILVVPVVGLLLGTLEALLLPLVQDTQPDENNRSITLLDLPIQYTPRLSMWYQKSFLNYLSTFLKELQTWKVLVPFTNVSTLSVKVFVHSTKSKGLCHFNTQLKFAQTSSLTFNKLGESKQDLYLMSDCCIFYPPHVVFHQNTGNKDQALCII